MAMLVIYIDYAKTGSQQDQQKANKLEKFLSDVQQQTITPSQFKQGLVELFTQWTLVLL